MSGRFKLNKLISFVSARGNEPSLPSPVPSQSNIPIDPEGLCRIAREQGLTSFPYIAGAGPPSVSGNDIGLPFLASHLSAFAFWQANILPSLVDRNYPTLEAAARSLRTSALAPHADFASAHAMNLKHERVAYPVLSTDFLTASHTTREILENEAVGHPPMEQPPSLHDLFSPREISSIMWVNQMNQHRMTMPVPSLTYHDPGRRGGMGLARSIDQSVQEGLLAFVPVMGLMMLMMLIMVAFERQRDDAIQAGKAVAPADTRRALKRMFSLGVDTDEAKEAEQKALSERLEREVNAQAHLVRREDLRFVPVPLEVHR